MTNSTFEANKDFYHINLCENFKVEYIEHETEKSYLLRGEGFKFWCPIPVSVQQSTTDLSLLKEESVIFPPPGVN